MARKFLYLIAIIIVLFLGGFTALRMFPAELSRFVYVPDMEFVEQEVMGDEAFAGTKMWFSKPEILENNPAHWVPDGYEANGGEAAIFYVHPTSYLSSASWNAPFDDEESRNRAIIFLRSQASVFNSVGDIWAPRYRQASIGAFLTDKPEAQQAINAAYRDVEQAFDAFIADIAEDKPIILAGHSQGALHLTYLLQNRVAGQPLAERIIATYIVGWPVSLTNDLEALGLPACEAQEQTGCILSWQSFAEPADTELILNVYDSTTGFDGQSRAGQPIVCTNPVTGTLNGESTTEDNSGTLVPNAKLNDGEIVPAAVPARCDERGFLLIGDPPDLGPYVLPGNNYHVYDFPLFWVDIRKDVERRTAAFLAQ